MSNANYLLNRQKYARPQAVLFANNPGTLEAVAVGDGQELYYVPLGNDILSDQTANPNSLDYYMILSDDNRSPIDFRVQRIEKRERMINGRMRSYHIADKLSVTLSWDMLPSRSSKLFPNFNSNGISSAAMYTSDGGAGGVEVLDWYESNTGPFWVFLSYDKYNQYGTISSGAVENNNLPKYNQVVQMYFSDFSYSVVKRGATNHDMWNISLTLEEV